MKFKIGRKAKNIFGFSLESICDASALSIAILGGPIALPISAGAVVLGRILKRGIDKIPDEKSEQLDEIQKDLKRSFERIELELFALRQSIYNIRDIIIVLAVGSAIKYVYNLFKNLITQYGVSLIEITLLIGFLWFVISVFSKVSLNEKQWEVFEKFIVSKKDQMASLDHISSYSVRRGKTKSLRGRGKPVGSWRRIGKAALPIKRRPTKKILRNDGKNKL